MKFRVHTYQTNRVSYEVEADSPEAAMASVWEDGWKMTPVSTATDDGAEWQRDMVIDPILPNGEVDYDNVKNVTVPDEFVMEPKAWSEGNEDKA